MTTYHFKDIIAFRTNQPQAHVMEMFGDQPFDPNDIEKEEYIGWIKTVISYREYLVATISPLSNFVCLVNSEDIVRRVEASELTEEQREGIHEFYMAPNVYMNSGRASWEGKSIDEKCCLIARKAMRALFPNDEIEEVSFTESDFIKESLIDGLYQSLKNISTDASEERKQELRDKADKLASWFETLRFKEYYTVTIGVQDEDDENITNFLMIAIDTVFEQVVITTDIDERTKFFYSLGPDYDSVYRFYSDFIKEATTQETVINIDI